MHAIRTADDATLRSRFLGGSPATDPETIRRPVEVDYPSRLTLVAFGHRRGVPIARYRSVPGQPGAAEVAVVIEPAWRRVGLVTAVLRLLADAAAVRGITDFAATYFASNVDVLSIISDTGLAHVPLMRAGIVDDAVTLPPLADAPSPAGR